MNCNAFENAKKSGRNLIACFVCGVLMLIFPDPSAWSAELELTHKNPGEVIIKVNGTQAGWLMWPRVVKPGDHGSYFVNYVRDIETSSECVVAEGLIGGMAKVAIEFKQVSPHHNRFTYRFQSSEAMPAQCVAVPIILPMSFMQSRARWNTSDAKNGEFPWLAQREPLYKGNPTWITWDDNLGASLTANLCDQRATEVVLLDNRHVGWKVFEWQIKKTVPSGQLLPGQDYSISFSIRAEESEKRIDFLVDRFGQYRQKDWPGKVRSETELKTDAAREKRELEKQIRQSSQLQMRDRFGGLSDSGKRMNLKATGFFRVAQVDGRWWFIDPEGNLFFSLGVCSLTTWGSYTLLEYRENLFEWIPTPDNKKFAPAFEIAPDGRSFSFYIANLIRKYGPDGYPASWKDTARVRFRAWGFNTTGAFGDTLENFPYTEWRIRHAVSAAGKQIPGTGHAMGTGIPDVFDESFASRLDQEIQEMVAPLKDDPWLVGYFLGNEEKWRNLDKALLNLPAEWAAKRKLADELQGKYASAAEMARDWEIIDGSWDKLAHSRLIPKNAAARKQLADFVARLVDTYYRLVTGTIRRHDPHHLILGSRYLIQTWQASPELITIASRYLDVVSANYYTREFDSETVKKYFRLVGKPILLSEWSYGAPDRGHVGGPRAVLDETARAHAYRQYVENAAALWFVVGSHWFEYIDQPVTGRRSEGFWGERYNVGLVDVVDRAYKEIFIKQVQQTNHSIYETASRARNR